MCGTKIVDRINTFLCGVGFCNSSLLFSQDERNRSIILTSAYNILKPKHGAFVHTSTLQSGINRNTLGGSL